MWLPSGEHSLDYPCKQYTLIHPVSSNLNKLVRMVTFASEDACFGDACQTAQDLVDSMSTVPLDYVRALGSPLVCVFLHENYLLVC